MGSIIHLEVGIFYERRGLQCPWEGRALRTASSSIKDMLTLHNEWRPSNSLMYIFLIWPLVCVLINVVSLGSTAGGGAERCCSCNNSPLTEMKAVIRPIAPAVLTGGVFFSSGQRINLSDCMARGGSHTHTCTHTRSLLVIFQSCPFSAPNFIVIQKTLVRHIFPLESVLRRSRWSDCLYRGCFSLSSATEKSHPWTAASWKKNPDVLIPGQRVPT